jgi:hypothetical protein
MDKAMLLRQRFAKWQHDFCHASLDLGHLSAQQLHSLLPVKAAPHARGKILIWWYHCLLVPIPW